jgi:regulator of sirC expression with transglutaminase-like and TPR domain
MISDLVVREFLASAHSADEADLITAALIIPRVEYAAVDPEPALATLAMLGERATTMIAALGPSATTKDRLRELNALLFYEEGFMGNEERYEDPRNSFMHDVIARRTGIPITLAIVYMDVARRAGLTVEGVNFPGHFLVRAPRAADDLAGQDEEIIVDPFTRGEFLNEEDCQYLLRRHLGQEAVFSRDLLATANKRHILARMLTNLKRLYVRFRSFPHARDVTHLLYSLDSSAAMELRDRGLLAYQLQDFRGALRDLEAYLQQTLPIPSAVDEDKRQEYLQIWEHVKNLRRRLASLN